MSDNIGTEVRKIITKSLNASVPSEKMSDDYQLAGNVLDSMALTVLLITLEDHFGIMLKDEELTPEDFETVASLTQLIQRNLNG